PLPDTPVATQQPGGRTPRPLAGPVVPLNASVDSSKSDQLLGGGATQQGITDAVATRVLVKGDSMPAPAGRADDFSWPRRAPAAGRSAPGGGDQNHADDADGGEQRGYATARRKRCAERRGGCRAGEGPAAGRGACARARTAAILVSPAAVAVLLLLRSLRRSR